MGIPPGSEYSFLSSITEFNALFPTKKGSIAEQRCNQISDLCDKVIRDKSHQNIQTLSEIKHKLLELPRLLGEKRIKKIEKNQELKEKIPILYSSIIKGIDNEITKQFHAIPDSEKLEYFLSLNNFG